MTIHPTRTCKAILKRLRALGADLPGPDDQYRVTNLRTGYYQRSAGAWSWSLDFIPLDGQPGRVVEIGGYYPATICAKDGATFDGVSLDPSDATIKAFQDKRR